MKLDTGASILVAVDPKWYEALQMLGVVMDNPPEMGPYLLSARWLIGTIASSDDAHGVWMRINEKNTNFPDMRILVPWQYVTSLGLPGANDESKLVGFVHAAQKKP